MSPQSARVLHVFSSIAVLLLVVPPRGFPMSSATAASTTSSVPPNVTYVETVAGKIAGFVDGNGSDARFNHPIGVTVDDITGTVYLCDYTNCAIRSISAAPPYLVKTIAGRPPSLGAQCGLLDAPVGTNARFDRPHSLCVHNGMLFLVEFGNHVVRNISLSDNGSYAVTVFAGQQSAGYVNAVGTSARFYSPTGIAYYDGLDCFLIADYANHVIRCVFAATRAVTTIAGGGAASLLDGYATSAYFNYPFSIAAVPNTTFAYLADYANMAVRVIDVSTRSVSTLAGSYPVAASGYADGNGTAARFYYPISVAYDQSTAGLVVTDCYNHALRWMSLNGNTSFLAGSPPPTSVYGTADGNATTARFFYPQGVAVMRRSPTTNRTTYVIGDTYGHTLRFLYLDQPAPPPTTATPQPTTPAPTPAPTPQPTTPAPTPNSSPSPSTRAPPSGTPTGTCTSAVISWNAYRAAAQDEDHANTTNGPTATPSPNGTSPGDQVKEAVPLQPADSSMSTLGDSGKSVTWTSAPLSRTTLQRRPSLALNLSASTSLYDVELRAVYLVLPGMHHGEAGLTTVATRLPLSAAAQQLPLEVRPQHYAVTVSLKQNGEWVSPLAPDGVASTIVAIFAECDGVSTTTLNIVIRLAPERSTLSVNVALVTSVVGSSTALGSVTTATTAARVSAVRELLLCSSSGASSGGLLGMSIPRPANEDGGDENLPSVRGAVVGNVIAVCVVGAVLSLVCCAYSVRCGVGLRASVLRLALPSTLLPILIAALPSTIGAVVYFASSSNATAVNVTLAVIGAVLCALPLLFLVVVVFLLPSRLELVLCPAESVPRRPVATATPALSTVRRYYNLVSDDLWVWKRSLSSTAATRGEKKVDATTTTVGGAVLDDGNKTHVNAAGDEDADLTAPERVGRTVLTEHRLLWFCLLDTVVVGFVAALAVGGSFGGSGACRASLSIVVALLVVETGLCVALKPYTTWRSHGISVVTLILSTAGAVLQLVASTLTDVPEVADSIVLASETIDFVVLVIASARLVVLDLPEMFFAGRQVAKEIAAGTAGAGGRGASLRLSASLGGTMSDSSASRTTEADEDKMKSKHNDTGASEALRNPKASPPAIALSNVMKDGPETKDFTTLGSSGNTLGSFGFRNDENDIENLLALNASSYSSGIRLGRANSATPQSTASPVLGRFQQRDVEDSDDSDL